MNTGKWSELSAEHEVRYNRNGSSLVTAMSKTSGVLDGLYGLVVAVYCTKIKKEFSLA
jgi:hypothetical protein